MIFKGKNAQIIPHEGMYARDHLLNVLLWIRI